MFKVFFWMYCKIHCWWEREHFCILKNLDFVRHVPLFLFVFKNRMHSLEKKKIVFHKDILWKKSLCIKEEIFEIEFAEVLSFEFKEKSNMYWEVLLRYKKTLISKDKRNFTFVVFVVEKKNTLSDIS